MATVGTFPLNIRQATGQSSRLGLADGWKCQATF